MLRSAPSTTSRHAARRGQRDDRRRAAGARRHRAVDRAHEEDPRDRRDDPVAVVEPGVITGDLQAAAEAQGLFYPPDPASLDFCSIGGNVAENAGGPRAFKYGVTREYVLGLEVR